MLDWNDIGTCRSGNCSRICWTRLARTYSGREYMCWIDLYSPPLRIFLIQISLHFHMGYRGDQLRGLYLPKYFPLVYAQEGLL